MRRLFPESAMSAAASLVVPAAPPVLVPVVGDGAFPVHRIYCVGRNYAEHAKEMGHSGREPPFFFLKPADTIVVVPAGETGAIDYPGLTADLHHEVELVVAIGRGGRDIAPEQAGAHVYGYAIGLDMTRRDLQAEMKKQGRPWEIGKAFEQSAPIGPIHPKAATGTLTHGAITLSVNGQPRQRGDLGDLIWNVDETIAAISRAWTLAPGDLIYTGTPAGVGAVVRGDVMEAAIEGLGTLRVAVR
jgi:fumarylpyruvate hydrolase